MATQSDTRQRFIKANPGVRLRGYGGYWYRCAHCGKWCGRPGREGAKTTINSIMHPVDTFVKAPVRKALRQNKVLKALGITKRR